MMKLNMVYPNRKSSLQTFGGNAGDSANSIAAWQPESELAQLQTEVFAATGVKVSADDPIMAVLVILKRDMKDYIAELTRRQDEQQDIFLANFRMQAQEVSQAAENLSQQQQHIVNAVLKSNNYYLQDIENKLLGSVGYKIKKQNQDEQQALLGSLKKTLLLSGCLFLVAQIMVLGLFAILAK